MEDVKNKQMTIAGYPEEIFVNKCIVNVQNKICSDRGKMLRHEWFNDHLSIYYDIHTSPGQSGSGLLMKTSEGKICCIGVHKGESY